MTTCAVDGCEKVPHSGRICSMHKMRMATHGSYADPRRTTSERFWAKVRPAAADECWEWQGARSRRGYGNFRVLDTRDTIAAHRYAYESLRAEIPDGLQLDHLCRNPPCVNPWHLEPVTNAENNRRAKDARLTCRRDHPRTPENTRINRDGTRVCRACERERRAA